MPIRYIAVLAGGKGERLWPLSRQNKPKQFLSLASGQSLLRTTLQRAYASCQNVALLCSQEHSSLLNDNDKEYYSMLIEEPTGRNTAAAVAYGCLEIMKKSPDATILFMPADHIVEPQHLFVEYVHQLFEQAERTDTIGLMGILPTYPATGYGYIKHTKRRIKNVMAHKVLCFKEKPSYLKAQEYIAQRYLWNSGIFCAKADRFIKEFSLHAPAILQGVYAYCNKQNTYENIASESIDYAIMEKSENLSVIGSSLLWSDIGNLEIFLSLLNHNSGSLITIDAHNNLLSTSKKLTALFGINNVCIVETPDVLFIAERTKVEEIKLIINELRNKGFDKYL